MNQTSAMFANTIEHLSEKLRIRTNHDKSAGYPAHPRFRYLARVDRWEHLNSTNKNTSESPSDQKHEPCLLIEDQNPRDDGKEAEDDHRRFPADGIHEHPAREGTQKRRHVHGVHHPRLLGRGQVYLRWRVTEYLQCRRRPAHQESDQELRECRWNMSDSSFIFTGKKKKKTDWI